MFAAEWPVKKPPEHYLCFLKRELTGCLSNQYNLTSFYYFGYVFNRNIYFWHSFHWKKKLTVHCRKAFSKVFQKAQLKECPNLEFQHRGYVLKPFSDVPLSFCINFDCMRLLVPVIIANRQTYKIRTQWMWRVWWFETKTRTQWMCHVCLSICLSVCLCIVIQVIWMFVLHVYKFPCSYVLECFLYTLILLLMTFAQT